MEVNQYNLLKDVNIILSNKIRSLENELKQVLASDNWNIARNIQKLKIERKIKSFEKRIKENKLKMKDMFDLGGRNKDIALYFGCSPTLIGRYKYLYKNGEI